MIRGKRILITGASGLLGHALCARLGSENEVVGLYMSHEIEVPAVRAMRVDLTAAGALTKTVLEVRPELVIHAAGLTNVDQCEENPKLAELLNAFVTRDAAKASQEVGAKFVHISTDHLFSGKAPLATEVTPIEPLNEYARSKARAEEFARMNPSHLILRTNFFGPGRPWRSSFSDWILSQLRAGKTVNAFEDVFFSPIVMSYFLELLEELVTRNATGVFNTLGSERISKFDFSVQVAQVFGFDHSLVHRSRMESAKLKAPRPHDMSLSVAKLEAFLGKKAPSVSQSLKRLQQEMA